MISWEDEYHRQRSGFAYLLMKGYLTHGEYQTLSSQAEKIIRFVFGPKKSPVIGLDEVGLVLHGFEMLQTLSKIEDLAEFYLQNKPKPAKGVLLSERVNPLALRGGDDIFEAMHFNAERGLLKIKCAPNHNSSGADLTVLARLFFKALMKLNRKLPIYDAELAFAEWARAFGSPLMGKDKSDLIPGIVSAYRKYRKAMIDLSRAFHNWEIELIETNGEENEAEDIDRMMSILTADPEPVEMSKDKALEMKSGNEADIPPTAEDDGLTDEPTPQCESPSDTEEHPYRSKMFHRFRVEWFASELRVTDEENFPTAPYRITPTDGNAARAALVLIRDYDAGNEQTHKSSKKWIGAFQSGRGDAARFREEQIFKLPKWSEDKRHYLTGQYCGKWRLWTDDEMRLPEDERIENFKAAHPHG